MLGQLVLALLLPAALAMAAVLWLGASKEEDRVLHQLASVTANAGLPLAQRVGGARRAMEQLSRQAAQLHGRDDVRLQRLMQAAMTQHELSGVYLVDRDGTVRTNTFAPIGVPLAQVREPELLTSLQSGLSRVTDLFVGPVSARQVIGITAPVVTGGDVRYTLNAGITVERLQAWISRQAFPDGWSVLVMDRRGTVLAHLGTGEHAPGATVPDALKSLIGQAPTTVHADIPLDGASAYTMVRTSGDLGWTTVVQAPRTTVLLALGRDMLLAVVALGVTGLLGLRLARTIANRIAATMDQVGQPPAHGRRPMAFLEAQVVHDRLQQTAAHAQMAQAAEQQAQRRLEALNERFEQRLLGELEAREAAIATELHDVVGSSLAGAGLLIASAKARPELVTTEWLDRCLSEVQRTAELTRKLARGILPVGSAPGAFAQSMEELAAHWDGLGHLHCAIDIEGNFDDVPAEVGNQVWRITQEAVNNAVRHGRAREVVLLLSRQTDACELRIVDDGTGVPADASEGLGMRSMRLRAQMLGGSVQWTAAHGGGCDVVLRWPLPPQTEPASAADTG